MVSIEVGFAEAGKVLDCSEHSRRGQSGEEFTSVGDGLGRICGNSTRTHNIARCLKCQIYNRREVRIETECTARLADNLAVPTIKVWITSREYIGSRWCGSSNVAKTIDPATLHVDTSKQGRRHARLALFEQPVRLLPAGDIAREKNHTRGLYPREQ